MQHRFEVSMLFSDAFPRVGGTPGTTYYASSEFALFLNLAGIDGVFISMSDAPFPDFFHVYEATQGGLSPTYPTSPIASDTYASASFDYDDATGAGILTVGSLTRNVSYAAGQSPSIELLIVAGNGNWLAAFQNFVYKQNGTVVFSEPFSTPPLDSTVWQTVGMPTTLAIQNNRLEIRNANNATPSGVFFKQPVSADVLGVDLTVLPDRNVTLYYIDASKRIRQRLYNSSAVFQSETTVLDASGGNNASPSFGFSPNESLAKKKQTRFLQYLRGGFVVASTPKSLYSADSGVAWSVPAQIATGYDVCEIGAVRGTNRLIAMLWLKNAGDANGRWYVAQGTVASDGITVSWGGPTLISVISNTVKQRGALKQDPTTQKWYFGYIDSGGNPQLAQCNSRFGEADAWA